MPIGLDAVVLKALAKTPDGRPGNAAEFSGELQAFLAGTPYVDACCGVGCCGTTRGFCRGGGGFRVVGDRRAVTDPCSRGQHRAPRGQRSRAAEEACVPRLARVRRPLERPLPVQRVAHRVDAKNRGPFKSDILRQVSGKNIVWTRRGDKTLETLSGQIASDGRRAPGAEGVGQNSARKDNRVSVARGTLNRKVSPARFDGEVQILSADRATLFRKCTITAARDPA